MVHLASPAETCPWKSICKENAKQWVIMFTSLGQTKMDISMMMKKQLYNNRQHVFDSLKIICIWGT